MKTPRDMLQLAAVAAGTAATNKALPIPRDDAGGVCGKLYWTFFPRTATSNMLRLRVSRVPRDRFRAVTDVT
jgi:hypothetical protein